MIEDYKKAIRETKEIQEQTYELMDSFRTAFLWMIDYCDKNAIPLPDMDRFIELTKKAGKKLETREFQPTDNSQKNQPDSKQSLFYKMIV